MAENSLPGTGMNPELVANSILVRAFRDNIPVSPMKLQKLLFFVTCLYQRNTSVRLLTESFQPWKYGPVVRSVHDEFKGFGGSPITSYARDAQGNAYAANEDSNPPLKQALDEIWSHMKKLHCGATVPHHPYTRFRMEQGQCREQTVRRQSRHGR